MTITQKVLLALFLLALTVATVASYQGGVATMLLSLCMTVSFAMGIACGVVAQKNGYACRQRGGAGVAGLLVIGMRRPA
jgi:hypothetical protein